MHGGQTEQPLLVRIALLLVARAQRVLDEPTAQRSRDLDLAVELARRVQRRVAERDEVQRALDDVSDEVDAELREHLDREQQRDAIAHKLGEAVQGWVERMREGTSADPSTVPSPPTLEQLVELVGPTVSRALERDPPPAPARPASARVALSFIHDRASFDRAILPAVPPIIMRLDAELAYELVDSTGTVLAAVARPVALDVLHWIGQPSDTPEPEPIVPDAEPTDEIVPDGDGEAVVVGIAVGSPDEAALVADLERDSVLASSGDLDRLDELAGELRDRISAQREIAEHASLAERDEGAVVDAVPVPVRGGRGFPFCSAIGCFTEPLPGTDRCERHPYEPSAA